ncbi:MAG TPA: hypothetical protein VGW75_15785 [Solirubrobacteraceae bacterium]|nr:hypothetical protein [Solirubrobacteraceae bacterium]
MIAVLVALALLALAPAAQAAVLTPEDAAELANALADATAVQGVCYGWRIHVSDPTGAEEGLEAGSSFGPGDPLDRTRPECRDGMFAELVGSVVYTRESSEAEDSAAWDVESNLRDPPTIAEVDELGYSSDDLLGDDNDLAIVNAAGALPQLAADHGNARPVPFAPAGRDPGTSGEPTGDPGSDLLRERGTLLALCALMILGGAAWLWVLRRDARRPPRRRRTTTAP